MEYSDDEAGPEPEPIEEAIEEAKSSMDTHWKTFSGDAMECRRLENMLMGKAEATTRIDFETKTREFIGYMNEEWIDYLSRLPIEDLSDTKLNTYVRYTDGLPLKDYEMALDLVPELVNLVSLGDAIPLAGNSLPFCLKEIASKCRGAVYYAPRRFTAVQLAYDEPRSRVLLFREC